jgi:hypothetical protein
MSTQPGINLKAFQFPVDISIEPAFSLWQPPPRNGKSAIATSAL